MSFVDILLMVLRQPFFPQINEIPPQKQRISQFI